MRTMFLAATTTALLAGCGIGAEYPKFGDADYRVEGLTAGATGAAGTRTVIFRDGRQMRVEAVLPTYGQATIVFDQATNAAYVLNPTGALPGAHVAAISASPQLEGIAVKLDDASAPQPLETAWEALGPENARSTGRCEVAGEEGREWAPREEPAPGVLRSACITHDGIVLRVRENDRVLWEASTLLRGPQSASLFGVPAGYRMIDPARVSEEVGALQLDTVTGAPVEAASPNG